MNDSKKKDLYVWNPGQHCLELDGVRGLAILLVTLYRFSKELDPTSFPSWVVITVLRVGERGVDLFFVLSGFLITTILLQTKDNPNYFQHFFIRRSLRIFPLYFFALIAFIWIVPSFVSNAEAFSPAVDGQFYLWTYLTNFRMASLNAWCFGPLDHFWSLAVEEHFYFIWPFVIFLLPVRKALLVSIAAILLIGTTRIACSRIESYSVAVEVLSLFRFDALCFGTSIALLLAKPIPRKRPNHWLILTIIPIAAICALSASFEKRLNTLPHTLCPLVWAVLLWRLVDSKPTDGLAVFFRNSNLRWLGKYSYAMYVFQLPLIVLVAPLVSVKELELFTGDPTLAGLLYMTTMFGLTCSIAWISFHVFEKHFLKLKPPARLSIDKAAGSSPLSETVPGWSVSP